MGDPMGAMVLAALASAFGAAVGPGPANFDPRSDSCALARRSPIVVSGQVEAEAWVKRPDRYWVRNRDLGGGAHMLSFADERDYWVGRLYRIRLEHVLKGEGPRPKDTLNVFLRPLSKLDDFGVFGTLHAGGRYLFFLVPPNADMTPDGAEPLDLAGTTVGRPGPPTKGEKPPQVDSIYRPVRYPKAISGLPAAAGSLDAVRACWDEAFRAPDVARLVAPEGPGIPSLPRFEWRAVERADSYQLTVYGRGDREPALELNLEAGSCAEASCASAAPRALAPGTYHWTVEARNRFGASGKLVPLEFRIGPNMPPVVEGGMTIDASGSESWRLVARITDPGWVVRCEWQYDPARVSITELTTMPSARGTAEIDARLLPGVESQEVEYRCIDRWGGSGSTTFRLQRD